MKRPDESQQLRGRAAIEGIVGGLGDILGKIADLAERAEESRRDGSFTTADGKEGRFQVGFNIRTMSGDSGEPEIKVEPFGDVSRDRTTGQASVRERREPPTDVFEEADHVLVVVEMPGIGDEDVQLTIDGDVLTVSAESASKRYYKEVLLPLACDAATMQVRAVNGVFEIRLPASDSDAA